MGKQDHLGVSANEAVQAGVDEAVAAATRLVKEGGAGLIKLDAAADFPMPFVQLLAPVFQCGRNSESLRTRLPVRGHVAIGFSPAPA